jgi:hypothetical protein
MTTIDQLIALLWMIVVRIDEGLFETGSKPPDLKQRGVDPAKRADKSNHQNAEKPKCESWLP